MMGKAATVSSVIDPRWRVALAVMALSWAGIPSHASDWPQFLGPERNGISQETGWNTDWSAKEPAISWKTSVGVGSASCAIADGKLYTMGNVNDEDIVFCLDAKTGKEIWTHRYPCAFAKRSFDGGTAATPTVDGDRVYTLSYRGDLFCLDKNSGEVRWRKQLREDFGGREPRWGYAGSPLIFDDMLITEPGGEGASVVALNKETGELIWKSGSDEASYASPAVYRSGAESRLAVMNAYGLVGMHPRTGAELFRLRWKTAYDVNATTPIYVSGIDSIFVCSGYRTGAGLVAIEGESGAKLVYASKDIKLKFQNALPLGDRVYGVIEKLKCLDLETGKLVWDASVSGDEGNVIAVDGKLLVLSERGELILGNPNPEGFQELGRIQVASGRCWVLPAFAGKRVYCRNNQGDLVCVDLNG